MPGAAGRSRSRRRESPSPSAAGDTNPAARRQSREWRRAGPCSVSRVERYAFAAELSRSKLPLDMQTILVYIRALLIERNFLVSIETSHPGRFGKAKTGRQLSRRREDAKSIEVRSVIALKRQQRHRLNATPFRVFEFLRVVVSLEKSAFAFPLAPSRLGESCFSGLVFARFYRRRRSGLRPRMRTARLSGLQ